MAFQITSLISWARAYTIVRRDSIAGYNLALKTQDSYIRQLEKRLAENKTDLAGRDMAHSATMQTLADMKNRVTTAESGRFIAEQQHEAARAQLKTADQWATALEKAKEKAEADAKDARAATEAANRSLAQLQADTTATIERLIAENTELKAQAPASPLAPPTKTTIYPVSVIVGVVKSVTGITLTAENGGLKDITFRVVPENDFIFNFAANVKIRPWVKDTNDCEDQTRQIGDKASEWGSNSLHLTGPHYLPGERHEYLGAVVEREDGTLTLAMVDPRDGKRWNGPLPDAAIAYG